jgi:hypothetical protein
MALGDQSREDESGRVIDLNGPLVALLCVAIFVLICCALSYGESALDRARVPARRERERSPGCDRRTTNAAGSEAPETAIAVAYALTSMDRASRSRRTEKAISEIVLGLQCSERTGLDDRPTEPCAHRNRAPRRRPVHSH